MRYQVDLTSLKYQWNVEICFVPVSSCLEVRLCVGKCSEPELQLGLQRLSSVTSVPSSTIEFSIHTYIYISIYLLYIYISIYLYICYISAIHLLYIYYISTIYLLYIYYISTIYLLHIYYISKYLNIYISIYLNI